MKPLHYNNYTCSSFDLLLSKPAAQLSYCAFFSSYSWPNSYEESKQDTPEQKSKSITRQSELRQMHYYQHSCPAHSTV